MPKRKPANPFEGQWLIESMTAWDDDYLNIEDEAHIEFERGDSGQFQFGYVYGGIDYRVTQRDGQPAVEFSWEGHAEMDDAFGRGWAVLDGDELNGMIFWHKAGETGFKARRSGGKKRPKR